jgi:SulP family sulfate permease
MFKTSKLTEINKLFKNSFLNDLLAGLTTAFPAIALGAAFGIESGRGVFAGIIAASIIPIITSIFGGTRIQASGPTAPTSAVSSILILFAYQEFGKNSEIAEQLITLTILLTSLFLILSGILKLGNYISLIPQVVIIGFMNGISFLIWKSQFNSLKNLEGDFWINLIFATVTFFSILFFPKILSLLKLPDKFKLFLPGTLIIIILMTAIFIFSGADLQKVSLESNISSPIDIFSLPQKYIPTKVLNLESFKIALPFALQLTMLAYLDSLLTALVMDKNLKEKSNKNRELMAQGLANGVASIFGGIPGAQATIRSVMLHKEGAKTRLAGVFVGIFVFFGIFVFKDLITLVATSIFTGILLKTGLDVFEQDYFIHFVKNQGWKKRNFLIQMAFVIYTTLITLFVDLNIAVLSATAGFLLMQKFLKIEDISETQETFSEDEA